jgi:hypothetical protein
MRRLLLGSIFPLAVGLAAPPASALEPERIPIEFVLLAEQGCGTEDILITGTLLISFKDSPGPNLQHVLYQGVSGVGLETGTRYSVTFMNQTVFYARIPGEELILHDVGVFMIVSRGPGPDFTAKGFIHLITRPDGTTHEVFMFEEGCR